MTANERHNLIAETKFRPYIEGLLAGRQVEFKHNMNSTWRNLDLYTLVINNLSEYEFRFKPNYKELSEELFKKYAIDKGVSRETYDGLLGIPTHCIEYKYGGWNNFIKACGLSPQYEAEIPVKIVSDYFQECIKKNKALSFYEYGKIRGNNFTLKMKRLFNAGKKYSYLKEELFMVSLNSEKHMEFLGKL